MFNRIFAVLISLLLLFGINACGSSVPTPPNEGRIKGDLLGKTMGSAIIGGLKFDSISEFLKFEIQDTKMAENTVEYTVHLLLRGNAGDGVSATINVVYRLESGEWRMVNLTDNGTIEKIKDLQNIVETMYGYSVLIPSLSEICSSSAPQGREAFNLALSEWQTANKEALAWGETIAKAKAKQVGYDVDEQIAHMSSHLREMPPDKQTEECSRAFEHIVRL